MKIRPQWVMGTLLITNEYGGYSFSSDHWPKRLKPNDLLRALLGCPDGDGWYVCHEDHRWLASNLKFVSQLCELHVGVMGMKDLAQLSLGSESLESISFQAAASLAVIILEKAYGVSMEDARLVVQMNIAGVEELA